MRASSPAVRLSAGTPLEWAPGTEAGYSNSGYLTVGLLIEQVTGQPFAQVLADRVLKPYGMSDTYLDETPTQGWVGHSAGGVVSTLVDLTNWGDALYRSGAVLSPASLQAMTTIDAALMSGLGAFPVCPCGDQGNGTVDAISVGHNGGSVAMHYGLASDLLLAVTVTDTVANPDPDPDPDRVANTVTYTEPDPISVVDTVVNPEPDTEPDPVVLPRKPP